MNAHAHVLAAPWQVRRSEGGLWAWLLIAVLVTPVVFLVSFQRSGAFGTLSYLITLWLQFWWPILFVSLLRQNHPNAARLVPGHVRVLREVAVGQWLAITLITAALQGFSLVWALGAAGLMLTMAALLRTPMLWFPFSVILSFAGNWYRPVMRSGLREWWSEMQAVSQLGLAAVALLLMAWGLCLMLQDGGAAHVKRYAGQSRMREALKKGAQGQNTALLFGQSDWVWRLTRWFMTPYYRWMEHLLRTAKPTAPSTMARAELLLGGHWIQHLAGGLIFLSVLGLCIAVGYFFAGEKVWTVRGTASFGLTIGAMSAALSPIFGVGAGLYNSRREQALLMLVPGMPRGAALNQLLARRLMLRVLVAWCFGLLFVCAMAGGTKAFGPALAFAFSCLPCSLILWRDWSRMKAPQGLSAALPALLMMLIAGVSAGAVHWLQPSAWWLLAVLPLTGLLGLWRWRRLSTYAQAFPVGRKD